MEHVFVTFWSLLETCRTGSQGELQCSAAAAARTIRARPSSAGLSLAAGDSLLSVDGCPVTVGADRMAAAHGLLGFLRRAGIARATFAADVGRQSLESWARRVVDGGGCGPWPDGIEVLAQRGPVEAAEPVRSVRYHAAVGAQSDSHLRSVFLQHRLIEGLPSIAGVAATTQKLVVQGVVDRLLQVPGGLEPLMLLQRDLDLLQRSTTVAVLTVLFASQAGWPMERLADIGAAGLLHDLGSILDSDDPGPVAFRWLLQRGDEDFWLRSAIVARCWRDGPLATACAEDGGLAVVALVRLAHAAAGAEPSALDRCLREVVDRGGAPAELAEVARQVVAAP